MLRSKLHCQKVLKLFSFTILAPSQAISLHQFGGPGLFPAPQLTDVYPQTKDVNSRIVGHCARGAPGVRCEVCGLGCWVWGWGLGFGVWGFGFGVWGLGFGVWGLEFEVWGFWV